MKRQDKRLAVWQTLETKRYNRAQITARLGESWSRCPPREGNRGCAGERGGKGGPNHRVTSEPHTDLRRQQGWSCVVNRKGNEVRSHYTKIMQGKILPPVKTFTVFSGRRILPSVLDHENNQTLSETHRFLTARKHVFLKNMLLSVGECVDQLSLNISQGFSCSCCFLSCEYSLLTNAWAFKKVLLFWK